MKHVIDVLRRNEWPISSYECNGSINKTYKKNFVVCSGTTEKGVGKNLM